MKYDESEVTSTLLNKNPLKVSSKLGKDEITQS